MAEGGLGSEGCYIGRDLFGGSFCFDPFTLYRSGALQNPNVVVIGDVGKGKALALDTPVPTPAGWTTMGRLRKGDELFDETGSPCSVVAAYPVRNQRSCWQVTLSDGSALIADSEHQWSGWRATNHFHAISREVVSTEQLAKLLDDGVDFCLGAYAELRPAAEPSSTGEHEVRRTRGGSERDCWVSALLPIPSVPVRCVAVDSPSRLFLVGPSCVPTHNSSLVKSFLLREQAFGRSAFIADVKGEYDVLAAAVGVEPVRLGPGLGARLNPLDPGPGAADLSAAEIEGRQLRLLLALGRSALGRELSPVEHAAVGLALAAVTGAGFEGDRAGRADALEENEGLLHAGAQRRTPTLPEVADALLEPSTEAARAVRLSAPELASLSRDVALVTLRMCSGDLAGMFDGPTNLAVDFDGPMVVLNLADIYLHNASALPLVMACATAWLQSAIARPGAAQRFVVIEEAWALLNNAGTARWLQASYKLARAWGVSNVAVLHRLSDLAAAGDDGTATEKLARGLLADAGTRVAYAQPPGEIARTRELLGLTGTEAELLSQLRRGVGLWKVGGRSFVVEHRLGDRERPIVDTDARMVTT
jgi:hypothetical protein